VRKPGRRWVKRLVAGLVLVPVVLVVGAAVAWADDPPDPQHCNPSNQQDHAGSGMPGWIDDQPTGGNGTTLYEQYGWSGMTWSNCQLLYDPGLQNNPADILPDMVKNPGAWIDTHLGNLFLGGATTVSAFMTQLNQWTDNPTNIMAPIDNSLATVSTTITNSTWAIWGGLIVIVAACLIVVWAMQADPRRAMRTVLAILFAAGSVAALGATWTVGGVSKPGSVALGQAFDHVASGVVGSVSSAAAGGSTPNISYGATLYDEILVPIWAQGAIGVDCTTDQLRNGGDAISQLCYDIFRANTTSYSVWQSTGADTDVNSYKAIAGAITGVSDGGLAYYNIPGGVSYYNQLRGVSGGRAGLGAKAFITIILIAIIRIPCSILLLMGLLVVRFVVMFIPIWALFAIIEATRETAKGAGKMVFAAVYNATIFGVFGVVHTLITAAIITSPGGFTFVKLLLIIALTLVVWVVSTPFRSVTVPATGDILQNAGAGVRSAMSAPLKLAGGVMAVKAYGRLRNINRQETAQTQELQQASVSEPASAGTASAYTLGDTYTPEPPRIQDTRLKARNPVKEIHMPIKVRSPLDMSEVDKATGEVHARLRNPIQTQKAVSFQAPVTLQDQRARPAIPAPAPPVLTVQQRANDAADRLAYQERARRHEQAQQWTPPEVR